MPKHPFLPSPPLSPGMPPKPRAQLRLPLNGDAGLGAVATSSFQSALEGIQFIGESPVPTPTSCEETFAEAIAAEPLSQPPPPPPSPPLPSITVCQEEAPPTEPPPPPPPHDEADGGASSTCLGTGHVVQRGRSRSCGVGGSGGVGGGDEDWDRHSVYHQPPKAADRDAAARLAKRLYHLDGFKVTDVAKHLYKR